MLKGSWINMARSMIGRKPKSSQNEKTKSSTLTTSHAQTSSLKDSVESIELDHPKVWDTITGFEPLNRVKTKCRWTFRNTDRKVKARVKELPYRDWSEYNLPSFFAPYRQNFDHVFYEIIDQYGNAWSDKCVALWLECYAPRFRSPEELVKQIEVEEDDAYNKITSNLERVMEGDRGLMSASPNVDGEYVFHLNYVYLNPRTKERLYQELKGAGWLSALLVHDVSPIRHGYKLYLSTKETYCDKASLY